MKPLVFCLTLLAGVWLSAFALIAQETNNSSFIPPEPELTVEGQNALIDLFQTRIMQGRTALLRALTIDNSEPEGTFLEQPLNFFQVPNDSYWYAFLVVPIQQVQRDYPLIVTATTNAGEETLEATIAVDSGGFIQQSVIVVGDAGGLINRELEDAELARLFELARPITDEIDWQTTGFSHPVNAELTSPFGAVRIFNGLYETLHTGWDYQATTGQPLTASAGGHVVFAGAMGIRGNYVMIDHGQGVYTGYAHLSVIFVTQGQAVTSGQIVGLVGSTGRSSSAHAHFEMILNDQWVDTRDFINMYLPR
jgi:murein DD-endopeptidase MepM/ murein hydrolase activator NlpD